MRYLLLLLPLLLSADIYLDNTYKCNRITLVTTVSDEVLLLDETIMFRTSDGTYVAPGITCKVYSSLNLINVIINGIEYPIECVQTYKEYE